MSKVELVYENFNKICRFCLKNDSVLQKIFSENIKIEFDDYGSDLSTPFWNKTSFIGAITSLNIEEEDDLPQNICTECYNLIESVMKFRIIARKSDTILREIISNHYDTEIHMIDPLQNQNFSSNSLFNVPIPTDFVETKIKPETVDYNHFDNDDQFPIFSGKRDVSSFPSRPRIKNRNINYNEDDNQGTVKQESLNRTKFMSDEAIAKRKRNRKKLTEDQKRRENERRKEREKDMIPIVCEVCGESHKRINVHMKIKHTEGQLSCEHCGKKFHHRIHLERHVNIHTRAIKYPCDQCGKTYSDRMSLKTHKIVHTGEKNHPCDICGRLFNLKSSLHSHKQTHIQNRRYECSECGNKFLTGTSFRQHMYIHTGEKPYICNYCSERFRTAGLVGIHAKKVHPEEVARDKKIMYTFEKPEEKKEV